MAHASSHTRLWKNNTHPGTPASIYTHARANPSHILLDKKMDGNNVAQTTIQQQQQHAQSLVAGTPPFQAAAGMPGASSAFTAVAPNAISAAGPAGGLLAAGTDAGVAAGIGAATIDMASVLAKIQALEREKADLHNSLAATQGRLSKLQEGKRAEMEQLMNSTINKWLEQLPTKDANSKETLRAGLEKLVKDGNESGVWEVVACASSNWQNNVNQIEALTQEVNSYREKERQLQGGLFQSEPSRFVPAGLAGQKRSAPEGEGEVSGYPTMGMSVGGGDMWSELESIFSREGGIRGVDYSGQQASMRGVTREAVQ